jgi:hypothetical protein
MNVKAGRRFTLAGPSVRQKPNIGPAFVQFEQTALDCMFDAAPNSAPLAFSVYRKG